MHVWLSMFQPVFLLELAVAFVFAFVILLVLCVCVSVYDSVGLVVVLMLANKGCD